jgi:beta-lactamase superfamily II metal-dependent hydrolase
MPRVHYLNVRNGDSSIIQHASGHVTVIDVSCGRTVVEKRALAFSVTANESWEPVPGNFGQKAHPDNPIAYLKKLGVSSVFRFILTHPDMDHLDGIKDLFDEFSPTNFWDTANTKEFPEGSFGGRPHLEADWQFYKNLRDTSPDANPKRLVYYSGDAHEYFKDEGITILSPTAELVNMGNLLEDWNDASYVILYRTGKKKILFSGDSEDETWTHILENWTDAVSNVDVLIAPHHGRDSGRDYTFLKTVNPKLTIFGNASADHLAYDPWHDRGLTILTNNQAGYIVLDIKATGLDVYAKHEVYARALAKKNNWETFKNDELDAWYLGSL